MGRLRMRLASAAQVLGKTEQETIELLASLNVRQERDRTGAICYESKAIDQVARGTLPGMPPAPSSDSPEPKVKGSSCSTWGISLTEISERAGMEPAEVRAVLGAARFTPLRASNGDGSLTVYDRIEVERWLTARGSAATEEAPTPEAKPKQPRRKKPRSDRMSGLDQALQALEVELEAARATCDEASAAVEAAGEALEAARARKRKAQNQVAAFARTIEDLKELAAEQRAS